MLEKDVLEIKGKVNKALCYAKVIEDEAVEQIRRMCDYEFTQDSRIRIMPDVHAGKGCTIGTTMTITDKVVPNIVGVDIGCGMYTVNLGRGEIDFEKLMQQHILSHQERMYGKADKNDLIYCGCVVIGISRMQSVWREALERSAVAIILLKWIWHRTRQSIS